MLACASFKHVYAVDMSVQQVIIPLGCTITQVNSGQQMQTTVSANCGTVVVPQTYSPVTPPYIFAPSSVPDGSNIPTSSGGGVLQPIGHLNNMPNLFTARGLTVVVQTGNAYTFRIPSDNLLASPRTIHFKAVGQYGVAVALEPGSTSLRLDVGEKKWLDLDGDGHRDMLVQVLSISADNVAAVRVSLDDTHLRMKDGVIPKQDHIAAIVLAGGTLLLLTVGMHFYHRLRLPKLPKGWHNHFTSE